MQPHTCNVELICIFPLLSLSLIMESMLGKVFYFKSNRSYQIHTDEGEITHDFVSQPRSNRRCSLQPRQGQRRVPSREAGSSAVLPPGCEAGSVFCVRREGLASRSHVPVSCGSDFCSDSKPPRLPSGSGGPFGSVPCPWPWVRAARRCRPRLGEEASHAVPGSPRPTAATGGRLLSPAQSCGTWGPAQTREGRTGTEKPAQPRPP